jgi:hypothetical protein
MATVVEGEQDLNGPIPAAVARDRVRIDHWLAVVQVRRARNEVARPAAKADTPASAIGLHPAATPAVHQPLQKGSDGLGVCPC